MKRIVLSMVMLFGLSAAAFDEGIDSHRLLNLNKKITELLAPLKNAQTKAYLTFFKIEYDAQRALSLIVAGLFEKSGPFNHVKVDLENLDYQYGNGTPALKVKGSVGINLTQILGQDELNVLIPEVENIFQTYAADYLKEYGEAASASVKINNKVQDADGNYVSIAGELSVKLDLAKLPQSLKAENIYWTSGTVKLGVDLTKGFAFEGHGIGNPLYKGDQGQERRFRDDLEKLLALDAGVLYQLTDLFNKLNMVAESLVNKDFSK